MWHDIVLYNKYALMIVKVTKTRHHLTTGNSVKTRQETYILYQETKISLKFQAKNIILLGDFNSRSNTQGKNIQQQDTMVQLLDDIINRHKLYIITKYHHRITITFKRSNNTGKSTINLTFVRGLKNVQVKAK